MEGDAGASWLNPAKPEEKSASDGTTEDPAESDAEADRASTSDADDLTPHNSNASRLGRGWLIGIAAVLALSSAGIAAGGYLALRFHQEAQVIAQRDAAAVEAAKDCVQATQAPDIAAMAASQEKIINCGTGDFRAQAVLYSSLLVEAYQAANAHVQVSDIRAAAEHHNADGSVDVLVALRVKVSNSDSQNQEAGYRLRVKMVSDDGRYRIAKLDQVGT